MKKICLIGLCLAVSLTAVTQSSAEAGGNTQMGLTQQEAMRERLEHGSVMHRLMLMTDIMTQVAGKISAKLRDIPAEKMRPMAGLMKDLADQAAEMSLIMEKGNASPEELMRLQNRTLQMQQKMSEIKAIQ
jgi:hypothetical protein